MRSGWNMPDGVFSTPEDRELLCDSCGCVIREDDEAEGGPFEGYVCMECYLDSKEEEEEE